LKAGSGFAVCGLVVRGAVDEIRVGEGVRIGWAFIGHATQLVAKLPEGTVDDRVWLAGKMFQNLAPGPGSTARSCGCDGMSKAPSFIRRAPA
jgi:hypothetical protein